MSCTESTNFVDAGQCFERARHHRRPRRHGHLPRRRFRSHAANRGGGRADKDDAGRFAGGREIRILAQKPVPGMNGIGPMFPRRLHDAIEELPERGTEGRRALVPEKRDMCCSR